MDGIFLLLGPTYLVVVATCDDETKVRIARETSPFFLLALSRICFALTKIFQSLRNWSSAYKNHPELPSHRDASHTDTLALFGRFATMNWDSCVSPTHPLCAKDRWARRRGETIAFQNIVDSNQSFQAIVTLATMTPLRCSVVLPR